MKKNNAIEYVMKVIKSQINALSVTYPVASLDITRYHLFLKQAKRIRDKINNGLLDEKQKVELITSLNDYVKIVEDYKTKAKFELKSLNKLEEKIEKTTSQPKITSQSTAKQTQTEQTQTTQTPSYKPKGIGDAKKDYYTILGKIAKLEAHCREIATEKFSVKEFYKLLNEIENAFIKGKLHSDDSRYLWQKYKPIKDNAKETLRKESEISKKNIEKIVEKGMEEIEKGNLFYAKTQMFEAFNLFKKGRMNRDDKNYCSERINELKQRLNELKEFFTEYDDKIKNYKTKAIEILDEIKKVESNPYNMIEKIQEMRLEMKAIGVDKKNYKKIDKILRKVWQIASNKIYLEKQQRERNKIEKEIRYLEESNEKRVELIKQTQKEIAGLRAKPFNHKIIAKEEFIKKLKEQIKETESKIRRLKNSS